MELNDEKLDSLCERIMKLPGISSEDKAFVLMEPTGDKDNEVFFKFMSDGGTKDNKNGKVLNNHLIVAGLKFEYFDKRKFIIDAEVLDKFLG